ncbi:MAG: hypothetical protein JST31_03915 [Actinobacteria bacterium]|nr:hypothetical protein [Actinomycetota bacterium]
MATSLDRRERRPGRGPKRDQRRRRWPLGAAARWLLAPATDVVRFSGAGRARESALEPGSEGAQELAVGLELWRARIERRRRLAVARRAGIVTAMVGAPAAALAALGVLPAAVAIGIAVAMLALALWAGLRRRRGLAVTAQLLDERLRLYDRLGTALEIERRGGARTPLERRAHGDAVALLAAGEGDWRLDPAPAPGEWGALAALLAVAAVLVVVGGVGGGGAGGGSATSRGGAGPGGTAGEAAPGGSGKAGQPGAPSAPRRGGAGQAPQRQGAAPGAGFRQLPQPPAGTTPQGTRAGATGASGQGKGARGGPAADGKGGVGKGGGEAESPGSRSHPTRSEQGNGTTPHGAAENGASPPPGGASPPRGATPGDGGKPGTPTTSTPGQGAAKGGTPTGTPTAGGGAGNQKRGQAAPVAGEETRKVRLQPGYAPQAAGRGGGGSRFGKSQGGGGRGRGGEVAGAGAGTGEFAFVPASGGAVAGPTAQLQQSYRAALRFVERLPW